MTEKLTDEQRVMAEYHRDPNAVINELLALRAERAKPMQSDDERAREVALLAIFGDEYEPGVGDAWAVTVEQVAKIVAGLIASIRAEGSAERAKPAPDDKPAQQLHAANFLIVSLRSDNAELRDELASIRAERAKPPQGDYSPTEHERVLAGDLIETVTDFDLEYDERTEAVFLAFASILAERAKTTQGDEERVNELCNDHNEDGSQSPHLAKDILALIASIRTERAKPTQSDEERARVLAIAVLTDCAMRYIEGPQSQVDRAVDLGTRTVLPLIASIRAEGSAERAKLEAAARKLIWAYQRFIGEGATNCYIDAVLATLARPVGVVATEQVCEACDETALSKCRSCTLSGEPNPEAFTRLELINALNTHYRIADAIAPITGSQPAESGATERAAQSESDSYHGMTGAKP